MFKTGAQLAILVVLAGLFFWRESLLSPGVNLEEGLNDWIAANIGSRHKTAKAKTVVIGIDDNSLASHPWPWTPLDFALFFQAALPFRPEVIAAEEVFD